MKYKDIKTGAIIITDSVLSGDWVLADELLVISNNEEPKKNSEDTEGVIETAEVAENLNELTVPELKTRLDELGVTYPTNAKKQDLIDILVQF